MAHHHHHHHIRESGDKTKGRKLLFATLLNFSITIAQVIGGIISNSLALLSDALHNLSDAIATFIAYIAFKYSKRPSNVKKTFGYKRVQILAAFINGIVLVAISFYLFYEAILRLQEPEPIKGLIMFIVASIGLLANLVAVVILRKETHDNLNIRAAYIHLLGDTMSSVAVIIGGVLIYLFSWYWIDPVVTILIGLYILKETWHILKETVDILMQAAPRGINLEELKVKLEALPEVSDIHHVHIWNLDDQSIHFECHVDLTENLELKEVEMIREKIAELLLGEYHITHVTIQFEHGWCHDKVMINQ
jgi:cobalt-zinc-cadmium efflux system protein